MKLAKDIMTSPVKVLEPHSGIREITDFFKRHNISGAPVVNQKGYAVGLISRTDLVTVAQNDPETAKELMTSFVFDCHPDSTLKEVAACMAESNIRRVIITEENRPVGVITALDIVREYAKS